MSFIGDIGDFFVDTAVTVKNFVQEKAGEVYDAIYQDMNYANNNSSYPVYVFTVIGTIASGLSPKGLILGVLNNVRKDIMDGSVGRKIIRPGETKLADQNIPNTISAVGFTLLKDPLIKGMVDKDPTYWHFTANAVKNVFGDEKFTSIVIIRGSKTKASFVIEDDGIYESPSAKPTDKTQKVCGWGAVADV